jgi:hypothetical protein
MEEEKWLVPVCRVPVAVDGQGNCADSWDPSLIFGSLSFWFWIFWVLGSEKKEFPRTLCYKVF